jgi:hypothetical protein
MSRGFVRLSVNVDDFDHAVKLATAVIKKLDADTVASLTE